MTEQEFFFLQSEPVVVPKTAIKRKFKMRVESIVPIEADDEYYVPDLAGKAYFHRDNIPEMDTYHPLAENYCLRIYIPSNVLDYSLNNEAIHNRTYDNGETLEASNFYTAYEQPEPVPSCQFYVPSRDDEDADILAYDWPYTSFFDSKCCTAPKRKASVTSPQVCQFDDQTQCSAYVPTEPVVAGVVNGEEVILTKTNFGDTYTYRDQEITGYIDFVRSLEEQNLVFERTWTPEPEEAVSFFETVLPRMEKIYG